MGRIFKLTQHSRLTSSNFGPCRYHRCAVSVREVCATEALSTAKETPRLSHNVIGVGGGGVGGALCWRFPPFLASRPTHVGPRGEVETTYLQILGGQREAGPHNPTMDSEAAENLRPKNAEHALESRELLQQASYIGRRTDCALKANTQRERRDELAPIWTIPMINPTSDGTPRIQAKSDMVGQCAILLGERRDEEHFYVHIRDTVEAGPSHWRGHALWRGWYLMILLPASMGGFPCYVMRDRLHSVTTLFFKKSTTPSHHIRMHLDDFWRVCEAPRA